MLKRCDEHSGFTKIIYDHSGLSTLVPHWSDLCQRGTEENVYYSPHYALSLLETVSAKSDVRFVTAWDDGLLVSLQPIVVAALPVPGFIPAGRAWQTDYTFGCMPILDRSRPHDAALALLDGMSMLKSGEWVLPQINAGGPACRAMMDALDSRHTPWVTRGSFSRASIKAGQSFDEHMRDHVSAKRRRELARNRRRLEELGAVVHQSHISG
jgi:hypothetical protein